MTSGRSRSACATRAVLSGGGGSGRGSSFRSVRREFRKTHGRRQSRGGRLHVIARLNEQKLRFREVHSGKADVESGPEIARGKGRHLIDDKLARIHRILCHSLHRTGAKCVEVGAIDLQQHIGATIVDLLALRVSPEIEALDKILGAAEVGNQLTDRKSRRKAIENYRIVQCASGDSTVGRRLHPGHAPVDSGIVRRPHLTNALVGRQGSVLHGADLWMILDRSLFCVFERQTLDVLRQGRDGREGQ